MEGLQDVAIGIKERVEVFISEKPLQTAGIVAGAIGVTALGVGALVKRKKKAVRVRKKKGRSRDRKFISKQKHEQAYIRRKRKAGKKITRPRYKTKSKKRTGKIYYTKKGQPYKIMASGKARFIKKSKGRRK